MTTNLADRTIEALGRTHDDLAALVATLSPQQLAETSGAAEWTVAQVLSHLGSGAEISRAGFEAAREGSVAPGQDFNQGVWDRWNALDPQQQADGFVEHDAALIDFLDTLTPDERSTLEIKLGFVPAPLSIASMAGMRLNEATLHAWDVRAAFDSAATLDPAVADLLVEHFTGGLGFLLGFLGKTEAASKPSLISINDSGLAIVVGDRVSLTTSDEPPTAAFSGQPEAALRLMSGRLSPQYTPAGVDVTGNVTLDELRRVFPGY